MLLPVSGETFRCLEQSNAAVARCGERDEQAGRVPGGSARPARAGGELKRDMGHFRPRSDVLRPAFPIPFGACVDMQSCRQSFAQEFFMHDQDPLLAVQIVPTWLVNKQAEVGRRHEGDTEASQGADRFTALRAKRPPPFERTVLCGAGEDHRNIRADSESFRESCRACVARLTVMPADHAVQRQADSCGGLNGIDRPLP